MLLAIKQAQADLADLWKPDIPIRDLFADIAAWCDTHDLMSTHVVTIFANLLSECTARMVHEMSLTAAREFMAQVINVLHDVRDAVLDNEMPGVRIPVEVPEEEESRE